MHYSMTLGILLVLFAGTVLPGWADDESTGPYLTWEFSRKKDAKAGTTFYYQKAVNFMDASGKLAWRTQLPARMQQYQAGLDDVDMKAIRAYPRQAVNRFTFLCGIVFMKNCVAIGDTSGLLILDRKDGSVIMDYSDEQFERGEFLFFDKGTYTITNPTGESWSGETRRAAFIAPCGKKLIFFNGYTMALFTMDPWKLVTALQYRENLYRLPSRPAHSMTRFTIDGTDVLLEGIIYLH
jgi:hypothetical protein